MLMMIDVEVQLIHYLSGGCRTLWRKEIHQAAASPASSAWRIWALHHSGTSEASWRRWNQCWGSRQIDPLKCSIYFMAVISCTRRHKQSTSIWKSDHWLVVSFPAGVYEFLNIYMTLYQTILQRRFWFMNSWKDTDHSVIPIIYFITTPPRFIVSFCF